MNALCGLYGTSNGFYSATSLANDYVPTVVGLDYFFENWRTI